jgi:hypothetical protein
MYEMSIGKNKKEKKREDSVGGLLAGELAEWRELGQVWEVAQSCEAGSAEILTNALAVAGNICPHPRSPWG